MSKVEGLKWPVLSHMSTWLVALSWGSCPSSWCLQCISSEEKPRTAEPGTYWWHQASCSLSPAHFQFVDWAEEGQMPWVSLREGKLEASKQRRSGIAVGWCVGSLVEGQQPVSAVPKGR